MEDHNHATHEPAPAPGFWQSRTGVTLIVFLAIAAVLLGYEHRAHIFDSTYSGFAFLAVWVGLHFFMHRGHGGHSGHGSKSVPVVNPPRQTDTDIGDRS